MLWEGLQAYQVALVMLLGTYRSLPELAEVLERVFQFGQLDCMDVHQAFYEYELAEECSGYFFLSVRGEKEAMQLLRNSKLCTEILCDEVLHNS